MFGRKNRQISSEVVAGGGASAEAMTSVDAKKKTAKVKPPSPIDIMTGEIERLSAGQVLRYELPEVYGGDLAVIQANPDYPQKGKKYRLGSERIVDGKPAGKINFIWDTNKPMDLAKWVLERNGVPFN
jgi:hypothetical protein